MTSAYYRSVEKAHNGDLHCVDWNPNDVNLILTGIFLLVGLDPLFIYLKAILLPSCAFRMRKQIGSEILTFAGVKKGDEVQI
ncbi:hypothetical protein OROMI_006362 [Orobanche minor]